MRFSLSIMWFALMCLASCKAQFEPIDYGHDACQHCKMTIVDKRFAAEILTKKGKAFKFDDVKCLTTYAKDAKMPDGDMNVFVADYNNPGGGFLDASTASYLHSDAYKSPMNGNMAAFSSTEMANKAKGSQQVELLTWKDIQ